MAMYGQAKAHFNLSNYIYAQGYGLYLTINAFKHPKCNNNGAIFCNLSIDDYCTPIYRLKKKCTIDCKNTLINQNNLYNFTI